MKFWSVRCFGGLTGALTGMQVSGYRDRGDVWQRVEVRRIYGSLV